MIANEQQYLRTLFWAQAFEQAAEQSGIEPDPLWAKVFLEAGLSQAESLYLQLDEYDRVHHGDRQGHWMPTYSGKRFWPEDPRPEDIDIRDIAHALSLLNRFNGHTRVAYCVAQHVLLVESLLPPPLKPLAFHHDSGEAYLGDVITPLKRLFRPFYEPLERRVMEAIATRYGFSMPPDFLQEVKRADLIVLATEVRDLTTTRVTNPRINCRHEPPLRERIVPWPAEVAEERFLARFHELFPGA